MDQITLSDVGNLGSILGVWAHPDDETFCSGGIMATAINNGQQVVCITATKGEKGIQDPVKWPPERLGQIRETELAEALKILGVKDHHWLNYGDGQCQSVEENDAAKKLRALIEKYQPDTILTFSPDGLTGHPDHQAVSRWVSRAATDQDVAVYYAVQLKSLYEKSRQADEKFNIFFNIDQPLLIEEQDCQIIAKLPEQILKLKCQALRAMPSQYQAMFKGLGEDNFSLMFSKEAFIAA